MSQGPLPTVFIPHGGGPCFFMDWDPPDTWHRMALWLKGYAATLPYPPKAILMISAHWEAREFRVTSASKPSLIYDYFGFPPHTYTLTYPASGSQELTKRVSDLLAAASIPVHVDAVRGFDHGVFIPLKMIYPNADIPIVQLSLKEGLDPETHLEVGRALASLRDEEVLIVGSGMSYHNLRDFLRDGSKKGEVSSQFDAWLSEILEAPPEERWIRMKNWEKAPVARLAHPREEHLLPLIVVLGAAGSHAGRKVFTDLVMGATLSAYEFGRA